LLLRVADKFENLKAGPEKASIAIRLFGRAGADLIPVLNQGRDGIEGLGVKISDDFAETIKAVQ
jgi:hypothetical protein